MSEAPQPPSLEDEIAQLEVNLEMLKRGQGEYALRMLAEKFPTQELPQECTFAIAQIRERFSDVVELGESGGSTIADVAGYLNREIPDAMQLELAEVFEQHLGTILKSLQLEGEDLQEWMELDPMYGNKELALAAHKIRWKAFKSLKGVPGYIKDFLSFALPMYSTKKFAKFFEGEEDIKKDIRIKVTWASNGLLLMLAAINWTGFVGFPGDEGGLMRIVGPLLLLYGVGFKYGDVFGKGDKSRVSLLRAFMGMRGFQDPRFQAAIKKAFPDLDLNDTLREFNELIESRQGPIAPEDIKTLLATRHDLDNSRTQKLIAQKTDQKIEADAALELQQQTVLLESAPVPDRTGQNEAAAQKELAHTLVRPDPELAQGLQGIRSRLEEPAAPTPPRPREKTKA
jgi:hypothetical protein